MAQIIQKTNNTAVIASIEFFFNKKRKSQGMESDLALSAAALTIPISLPMEDALLAARSPIDGHVKLTIEVIDQPGLKSSYLSSQRGFVIEEVVHTSSQSNLAVEEIVE